MGIPNVGYLGFNAISAKYSGFKAPVVNIQMGNSIVSLLVCEVGKKRASDGRCFNYAQ